MDSKLKKKFKRKRRLKSFREREVERCRKSLIYFGRAIGLMIPNIHRNWFSIIQNKPAKGIKFKDGSSIALKDSKTENTLQGLSATLIAYDDFAYLSEEGKRQFDDC